jgi:hypothetical protein
MAKSSPGVRAPIEACFMQGAKSYFSAVNKAFTVDGCARVVARVVQLQMLDVEDEQGWSLGCGAATLISNWTILHAQKSFMECDTTALFGGAVTLLRRVCPSPLPAEWWVTTCAEVDVTSVRLALTLQVVNQGSKMLDQAVLDSASWLGPAVTEAVHICKVNASAGLSARPTMSHVTVFGALAVVEVGAKVQSHATSLLKSGVIEALEYACVNDFTTVGASVSKNAAGAVLALVGRNEGGRTLSQLTANTVVDGFATYFDPSDFKYQLPVGKTLLDARRVATMAISDANKKIMLQHPKLLDTLVSGLLLDNDNPRRGQDGADALQEECTGVLHELALYGPTAAALRSHTHTMEALRALAETGAEGAQKRAVGALFELDEEARSRKHMAASVNAGESGKEKSVPHIMASYNWDHQDTILRLVKALQARGYVVWVDVEQMKGSTVDAMAEAVEGAEVMLIGVSRVYKESSNCRMEAQYGMQRQKDMIPLMMQEGYQADGWLGMLLGTKLWHPLFGETLSNESVFEDRMSALVREIGTRGRADALVVEPSPVAAVSAGKGEGAGKAGEDKEVASAAAARPTSDGDCVETDESNEVSALRSELESVRLKALDQCLQRTAAAAAVSPSATSHLSFVEDTVSAEGAAAAARPLASEVELLLRAELVAMRVKDLRSRAKADGASLEQLEAAADADDPKAAVVELVLSLRPASAPGRVGQKGKGKGKGEGEGKSKGK